MSRRSMLTAGNGGSSVPEIKFVTSVVGSGVTVSVPLTGAVAGDLILLGEGSEAFGGSTLGPLPSGYTVVTQTTLTAPDQNNTRISYRISDGSQSVTVGRNDGVTTTRATAWVIRAGTFDPTKAPLGAINNNTTANGQAPTLDGQSTPALWFTSSRTAVVPAGSGVFPWTGNNQGNAVEAFNAFLSCTNSTLTTQSVTPPPWTNSLTYQAATFCVRG